MKLQRETEVKVVYRGDLQHLHEPEKTAHTNCKICRMGQMLDCGQEEKSGLNRL